MDYCGNVNEETEAEGRFPLRSPHPQSQKSKWPQSQLGFDLGVF